MADLVPMSQAATTSLVTTLQNTDLFALAREDDASETGYRSKVARVDAMAKKVVNETDYSQLQTTNKKIIGAINEVNAKASQFDNMTATASGSIASFDNGGDDIPVSEYECDIVAQQASGTPTPTSPLPITGFSQADIVGCGKNRLNLADKTTTIGSYVIDNENVPMVAGYYVLSFDFSGTSNSSSLRVDDENGTAIFTTTKTITSGHNEYLLNLPSKGSFVKLFSNAVGTYSKFQLEKGNSFTTYEPYKGNTYLVAFGQTIYGGRLIYKNGEWSIEATSQIVNLGDLNWSYESGANSRFTATITGIKRPETSTTAPNILCSALMPDLLQNIYLHAHNYSIGVHSSQDQIWVYDSDYTDTTSFKTAMSGVMLVYELATPTIIPITSSTRVKTISGVNNIFSNTGDNSVKYFTENADSLAELIKAFVV